MKRRIERASEQRTAMLNGVSHDLRTILTRFKLSLAVIDEFGRGRADAEGRRRDAAHARGLSRLRARRRRRADRADRSRATSSTTCAPTPSATARGSTSRPRAISTSGSGRSRIKRCLGNLVANAQRHAQTIALKAAREQRFVTIYVDDDGPGIAPEHREDVFRPFHRLDEARNQDEGGSGLGLAIARDIARSHGGEITLSSSPLGGLRAMRADADLEGGRCKYWRAAPPRRSRRAADAALLTMRRIAISAHPPPHPEPPARAGESNDGAGETQNAGSSPALARSGKGSPVRPRR